MSGPAALDSACEIHVLRLYIAGPTPRSMRAIVNIRRICEQHLAGRYDLEVVDILRNPEIAGRDDVIAAPMLARISPLPVRRFIGDLGNTDTILCGLDLPAVTSNDHE